MNDCDEVMVVNAFSAATRKKLSDSIPSRLTEYTWRSISAQSRRHVFTNVVDTPIHYQTPRQLLRTIVRGAKSSNGNRNFWMRCANAVIYHNEHFNAAELVQIANSFGKVNHHDKSLFRTIAKRALQCEETWRVTDIPVLLNSFRACDVYDYHLFDRALEFIVPNVCSLGPDGVALTLHSLTVSATCNPKREVLDALVSPLFKNISQFSINNLELILRSISALNYRNVALLQLIADHFAGSTIHSHPTYDLIKAFHELNYVDGNVVKIVEEFVSSNSHFMHVDDIPQLVNILISIHKHKELTDRVYQSIIRVVSRNQGTEHWKTIFGVKYAMDSIKQRDIYLDELCNTLRKRCSTDFSTQDKINVLRSCKGFALPLVYLYDTILSSFQRCDIESGESTDLLPLIDVTTDEYMDLVAVFSELGYIKGLRACLSAITMDSIDLTCTRAIKCREMFIKHVEFQKLDRAYKESVLNADICDLASLKPKWAYLEKIRNSSTPLDLALGICHAESTSYVCELATRLLDAPINLVEPEIIPAMLRRTIKLSHIEGYIPDTLKRLHERILHFLTDEHTIAGMSTQSFATLAAHLNLMDCPGVNMILPNMLGSFIQRVNTDAEDAVIIRHFCNIAVSLLTACTKHRDIDISSLAQCICIYARRIQPERLNDILRLFIKLGFNDNAYTSMLEPVIDDAVVFDSDMARVMQLEVGPFNYIGHDIIGIRNQIRIEI
ncbi:uncharacterized protein BXIN_0923 [Babesia sp. Xinjiang]|uniref:uncharacterized protein n=1 Tax=Babesia sp. Xinjiang TaxID=462227 RepID=UPI000A2248E3|nr:uncharacterized protein BXIN_0923 [Babesia sp. Xinjiang]ORM42072.1 hypothetical protein BXIN_0923 [Babesia sp. Xinjiang]